MTLCAANLKHLPDSCAASAKKLNEQRAVFEKHNAFSSGFIDGIIKKTGIIPRCFVERRIGE